MPVENPNDLKIGDTIRFKTINPHDNVLWTGKIAAITDYRTARAFDDVDTYYQDVIRANRDAGIGAKETLTYLLLNVSENDTTVTTRVFAIAYIDRSTLELVEENTYTDFRVYDIDSSKARDILEYITSCGYVAEIIQK